MSTVSETIKSKIKDLESEASIEIVKLEEQLSNIKNSSQKYIEKLKVDLKEVEESSFALFLEKEYDEAKSVFEKLKTHFK